MCPAVYLENWFTKPLFCPAVYLKNSNYKQLALIRKKAMTGENFSILRLFSPAVYLQKWIYNLDLHKARKELLAKSAKILLDDFVLHGQKWHDLQLVSNTAGLTRLSQLCTNFLYKCDSYIYEINMLQIRISNMTQENIFLILVMFPYRGLW